MTSPTRIEGPTVWRGPDIARDTSWIHLLTPEMVTEIDAALENVRDKAVPFDKAEFPLDKLAAFLDDVPNSLDNGPGFALLRGLPRDKYTTAECELIYWGIAVHLGTPISQNTRGHLVGHVRDEGKTFDDPTARAYQTKAKLDFHADQLPVDILGLFCLRTAMSGGESMLVSAHAVHNVILDERPDLLDILYQPYYIDWRGEEPPGEEPVYQSPMFSEADGFVASRFASRQYFKTVVRHNPDFAMSPEQDAALDFVQEVANRPGMALAMTFEEGDMQFLNNHALLHARSEFEDFDEPERKRHLMRLWVAYPPERRRQLSPLLAERYRYVEAGGIPVKV